MVISPEPVWEQFADELVISYENATVYGDFAQERILHEGEIRILPNSWIALPTGRLLSPEAVHHIDS